MNAPDWYEPLIMPLIMTFFGLLVWWMGTMQEQKGSGGSWKWYGIVLLIIGAGFGYKPFMDFQDFTYRSGLPENRRYAVGHYGALIFPLLAVVGCILWHFMGGKSAPAETPASE